MILAGMSVGSLGLPGATVCCRKSNGLGFELCALDKFLRFFQDPIPAG